MWGRCLRRRHGQVHGLAPEGGVHSSGPPHDLNAIEIRLAGVWMHLCAMTFELRCCGSHFK